MYGRNASRRFWLIPRMASRSSTRRKPAAFLPHIDDLCAVTVTHTRQFLEFLERGGVKVDGLAGGCFWRPSANSRKSTNPRRAPSARPASRRSLLDAWLPRRTSLLAKFPILFTLTLQRNYLYAKFDISLRIVSFDCAEKRGLGFDLLAIADDHNLRVGRVEIFLRRLEHVGGGERPDAVAIGLEVILGQAFEVDARQLAGQAVLRGQAQRKNAAQITPGVVQLLVADGQGERMRSIS